MLSLKTFLSNSVEYLLKFNANINGIIWKLSVYVILKMLKPNTLDKMSKSLTFVVCVGFAVIYFKCNILFFDFRF